MRSHTTNQIGDTIGLYVALGAAFLAGIISLAEKHPVSAA